MLGLFVLLRQLFGVVFLLGGIWGAVCGFPGALANINVVAVPVGVFGLYLLFIEAVVLVYFARRRDAIGFFRRYGAKLRSKTVFAYFAPDAGRAAVAGDFNSWAPSTWQMKKTCGGSWRYEAEIPPGTYRYKFIIDGKWEEDPTCPIAMRKGNAFGTYDSVIDVGCSRLTGAGVSARTQLSQILIAVAGAVLAFAASRGTVSTAGVLLLAVSMIIGMVQALILAGGLVREIANGEHFIMVDNLTELMWSQLLNLQVGFLLIGAWLLVLVKDGVPSVAALI